MKSDSHSEGVQENSRQGGYWFILGSELKMSILNKTHLVTHVIVLVREQRDGKLGLRVVQISETPPAWLWWAKWV